jgi:hypothetical protein
MSTPMNARRRWAGFIAAGACTAAVALGAAPTAAADQQFDEQWFLEEAPAWTLHITPGKERQVIDLTYALCALDKLGVDPATVVKQGETARSMLGLAKVAGLCKYVSADGTMDSQAGEKARRQAEAITDAIINNTNTATNNRILQLPPDSDNDGVRDPADNCPHDYNPGGDTPLSGHC